jgi:type I restriction enzyme R subunit
MDKPSFQEDHISQVPALMLLIKMGYQYINPKEALQARVGKTSNVILENILEERLRNMPLNKISYKGQSYEFSNVNINEAINAIKNIPFDGLIRTNEQVYDLLSLGKSFEETLQDAKRSFDLKFIDWNNWQNNVFHVTEEYDVERTGSYEHRRPDIVLFVNGIPFCVIECKRPDMKEPLTQAISQQIRNQRIDEIPGLFVFSQILMGLCTNDARYATCGTPDKFWMKWKEKHENEDILQAKVNEKLAPEQKDRLFKDRFKYVRTYFDNIENQGRLITEQDRALYYLLNPERLLELTRNYIVFDAGEKKIARHQQYFVVKSAIKRVTQYESAKKRKGGVIWHTQGSGKSITMVMLAKALALEEDIPNPRVIVVTDRKNLDKQIHDTFKHCGIDTKRARSGKDLLELLESEKNTVFTSVLFKFRSAVRHSSRDLDTENVFVLIDESHRSQYGSAHAVMNKMLPGACYIGFTGTPLMKAEKKNTLSQFGDFIKPCYTIEEATKDGAVVPLLYEGRHNLLDVNKEQVDKWFNRVSEPLSEYETADLKKKFTKKRRVMGSEDNIRAICYDISQHYKKTWQGTGFKGQLAVWSKNDALKYKKFFDEFNLVKTEVVISGPDDREGYEDVFDEEPSEEVHKFWQKMMAKYGDEETYNEQIINNFKYDDDPEILIVVSKLLTGFDAPKNTVLYLAKGLKEHTLLQAIARVNRVCEGKDFGYIIDYVGILEELDTALTNYAALEGFDEEDLKGALINIRQEIDDLPQKYTDLSIIFKDIKNKRDEEEYERFLYDEETRHKFYEKLSKFSNGLSIALSSQIFYQEWPENRINEYKESLKFYQNLRRAVRRRYAESVDFKEYEKRVQKLLDTYVTSKEMLQITEPVNIFDKVNFQKEVEKVAGEARRADMIASRIRKTIEEKYEEDPVFYEKFSKLLEDAISSFHHERITDAGYLESVKDIMVKVVDHRDDELPDSLKDHEVAKAFYGIIKREITDHGIDLDQADIAKISLDIDQIIVENKVVDFHLHQDPQNKIINLIEDYLADNTSCSLSFDIIDDIIDGVMKIALVRYK